MTGRLPPSASVAHPQDGIKLHAPAAQRNAPVLSDFLVAQAPKAGRALEIASGTGQHVTAFGAALPDVQWHPTDVDPVRLRSIDAYAADAGLRNVAPACHLDATQAGWSKVHGAQDLIVLINLLHLITTSDAQTIVAEGAAALAPGGMMILYGPFRRDGALTSAGDARFDAELRAADPAIGYKDGRDIAAWLGSHGLLTEPPFEMPANNLAFVARKPMPGKGL